MYVTSFMEAEIKIEIWNVISANSMPDGLHQTKNIAFGESCNAVFIF